jgi:hypothetical protein
MEPSRCSRWRPQIKCASRREAQSAGEMYYSYAHGGWIYPAVDRMVSPLLRDERKAPYTWRFCVFCGGALPDLSDAFPAIVDDDGN